MAQESSGFGQEDLSRMDLLAAMEAPTGSFLPSTYEALFRGRTPFEQEKVYLEDRFNPESNGQESYPDPTRVLYRSMILPGWGQVTNRQIWKVPIIYALFTGLGIYTYDLTRQYQGFRAAYYNETRGEESDFRYGPTPDFVPEGMPVDQMRSIRNNLRNSRDLSYVYIVLAYGLNVLDAYVFAHMRSFDVSDDLSANAVVTPGLTEYGTPGVRLQVNLFRGEK